MAAKISNRCRLCANINSELNLITTNLAKQIHLLYQLKIDENHENANDRFPTNICPTCTTKLKDSWTFYNKIKSAQKRLAIYVDVEAKPAKKSQSVSTEETDYCEIIHVKKTEVDSDIDDEVSETNEDNTFAETLDIEGPSEDPLWEPMETKEEENDSDASCDSPGDESSEVSYSAKEEASSQLGDSSKTWPDYPWGCNICERKCTDSDDYKRHDCFKDVKILLDANGDEGQLIYNSYKENRQFRRNELANLIVKSELQKNPDKKITTSRFINLAKQIQRMFPHESPNIYYVPYVNDKRTPRAARGKLWNCYVTLRQKYKKFGLLKDTASVVQPEEILNEVENKSEAEDSMIWLRRNVKPFTTCQEHWVISRALRRKLFKEQRIDIETYYKDFPCLRQPLGYQLLESDFISEYATQYNSLLIKWPDLCTKVIALARARKEVLVKHLLSEFDCDHSKPTSDQLQNFCLSILPLLFQAGLVKRKDSNIHNRPSKTEIKNSFILHAKTANNLEEILANRVKYYLDLGLTAQPVPIIVGQFTNIEDSAYYCSVNNILYKVDTLLRAVDLTFKLIHVLNAQYSAECFPCWMFIQKGIYNISTAHDKMYVSVSSVISDLKL